jgi:hypothetical protein
MAQAFMIPVSQGSEPMEDSLSKQVDMLCLEMATMVHLDHYRLAFAARLSSPRNFLEPLSSH